MNNWKRTGVVLLGVAAFLASAAALSQTGGTRAPGASDVVMMRCDARFIAQSYLGSPNAPAKRSANCPENLALMLKEGFSIVDVGYHEVDGDFVTYTLRR